MDVVVLLDQLLDVAHLQVELVKVVVLLPVLLVHRRIVFPSYLRFQFLKETMAWVKILNLEEFFPKG